MYIYIYACMYMHTYGRSVMLGWSRSLHHQSQQTSVVIVKRSRGSPLPLDSGSRGGLQSFVPLLFLRLIG